MLNRSSVFLGLMLTATLAAAALVGDDGDAAANVAASVRKTAAPAVSGTPVLQLERLIRNAADMPEQNPFAGKSWYVPPPPPPAPKIVQEAPRPTAPPLPFKFMGKMREEDGHEIVYLAHGSRAVSASRGDTIDGTYKVESIGAEQIVLIYLPLDIRQTLAAEGGNAAGGAVSVSPQPSAANYNMAGNTQ